MLLKGWTKWLFLFFIASREKGYTTITSTSSWCPFHWVSFSYGKHPWVDDAATYGPQLDALTIRPNSSKIHVYTSPKILSRKINLRTWVGIQLTHSHPWYACDALPIELSGPLEQGGKANLKKIFQFTLDLNPLCFTVRISVSQTIPVTFSKIFNVFWCAFIHAPLNFM